MPSSLSGRLIVVVRQAGKQTSRQADRQMKYLQLTKYLKFDNFNSKAFLGCLNGFMAPIASYQ